MRDLRRPPRVIHPITRSRLAPLTSYCPKIGRTEQIQVIQQVIELVDRHAILRPDPPRSSTCSASHASSQASWEPAEQFASSPDHTMHRPIRTCWIDDGDCRHCCIGNRIARPEISVQQRHLRGCFAECTDPIRLMIESSSVHPAVHRFKSRLSRALANCGPSRDRWPLNSHPVRCTMCCTAAFVQCGCPDSKPYRPELLARNGMQGDARSIPEPVPVTCERSRGLEPDTPAPAPCTCSSSLSRPSTCRSTHRARLTRQSPPGPSNSDCSMEPAAPMARPPS